jgi:hypothetical protein
VFANDRKRTIDGARSSLPCVPIAYGYLYEYTLKG